MRIFVTGATGFIGSAVVKELLGTGHQVIGLTRSKEGAKRLTAAGAMPHWGRLEDLESLRSGAASADGVIHLAFIHGFSDAKLSTRLGVIARGVTGQNMVASFMGAMIRTDMAAIETIGSTLAGSDRPFVITVGTMGLPPGITASEDDAPDPGAPGSPRSVPSEKAAAALASKHVRTSVLRLPPVVHDREKQGLVSRMIEIAQKKGVSAYVGTGDNRWPAVHRLDTASLFRLALEKGAAGGRYHAIAEQAVPVRTIAELVGERLDLPVVSKSPDEAGKHFGWLATFVSADNPASSELTQERLGWRPIHSELFSDLRGSYSAVSAAR
jgi:nucleoside-diphosphate-sugar epimerase